MSRMLIRVGGVAAVLSGGASIAQQVWGVAVGGLAEGRVRTGGTRGGLAPPGPGPGRGAFAVRWHTTDEAGPGGDARGACQAW
jgi:hypothetical protein